MNHYIYLHIRSDSGKPFYIGKGKGKRYESKSSRSYYWHNIVNKIGYDIIILENSLSNQEAVLREKYWIKRIGRIDLNKGPLVNFTDGGEGTQGKIVNKKTRDAIALSNKNRIASIINRKSTGSLYKGKFGKDHNRSISLIINGEEFSGYSEASRGLNILTSTLHYRVKSKNKKWEHFQIKN